MSNGWVGARAGAGRKSYAELNHCRELLKQGVSDQDWIDLSKELVILGKAWRSAEGKVKPRESIQAIKTLYRYQQALIPTAEEEKQAEEPEPIKLIEVHRSCERDCPVHPEYHDHADDDDPASNPSPSGGKSSSELPQVPPSSEEPPEPPYPGSPVGKYKYDGIPLEKIPSYKYAEKDFLSHIQPPPGPDLLGPNAPPPPPAPAEVQPPAPTPGQGSRKRVMALLEQERRARLASNPPTHSGHAPVPEDPSSFRLPPSSLPTRAPVPPTPGVKPRPEDFVPLPREFHRCIGRIPLSKWGLPPGCYIMPDGRGLIIGAGAKPKPTAPKPPGPGS